MLAPFIIIYRYLGIKFYVYLTHDSQILYFRMMPQNSNCPWSALIRCVTKFVVYCETPLEQRQKNVSRVEKATKTERDFSFDRGLYWRSIKLEIQMSRRCCVTHPLLYRLITERSHVMPRIRTSITRISLLYTRCVFTDRTQIENAQERKIGRANNNKWKIRQNKNTKEKIRFVAE